jgi:hypothetical protein
MTPGFLMLSHPRLFLIDEGCFLEVLSQPLRIA